MKSVLLAAVLVLSWSATALAQWTSPTTPDSDPIWRTGSVGIGGYPSQYFALTIKGNTTGVNNSIWFNNGANSAFEFGEAANNSSGVHLWNYKAGFIRFGTNNSEFMRLAADGTLGIRTASPWATLHVGGGATPLRIDSANGMPVIFRDLLTSEGYGSGILMDMSAGNSMISVAGMRIGSFGMPRINSSGAPLVLNAESSHGVEVGTTTNARNLLVTGDLVVNGNFAAKFQDLAEWVPTTSELPAGVVVVLDEQHSNHVLASSRPYDTMVAGVVSAQPGIMLGEPGDSKALIATTGRVRVRVDASRHAIRIGDLLVTSDVPGFAMKSIPTDMQGIAMHRPGTVLGKALEPLSGGQGEILVLLSLQ